MTSESKSDDEEALIFVATPAPGFIGATETTLLDDLERVLGSRIEIWGGGDDRDAIARLWVSRSLCILVPSVRRWEGAPSWRSFVAATGVLRKADGGFYLENFTYRWADS